MIKNFIVLSITLFIVTNELSSSDFYDRNEGKYTFFLLNPAELCKDQNTKLNSNKPIFVKKYSGYCSNLNERLYFLYSEINKLNIIISNFNQKDSLCLEKYLFANCLTTIRDIPTAAISQEERIYLNTNIKNFKAVNQPISITKTSSKFLVSYFIFVIFAIIAIHRFK